MDKYPIFWQGQIVGELKITPQPPYLVIQASSTLIAGEVCRLIAVGQRGEARLGIPEPVDGRFSLRRRISQRELAPIGPVTRCELRPCSAARSVGWQVEGDPGGLLQDAFLRRQLQGTAGALRGESGGWMLLALPFDMRRPFPLPSLFCLSRAAMIQGALYVVFAFDRTGRPAMCPPL